jgi:hypothetical protein
MTRERQKANSLLWDALLILGAIATLFMASGCRIQLAIG